MWCSMARPVNDAKYDRMKWVIQNYWIDNRCPPTFLDLMYLCGYKSTSPVSYIIGRLEADGWLEPRAHRKHGSIVPSNIRITFE